MIPPSAGTAPTRSQQVPAVHDAHPGPLVDHGRARQVLSVDGEHDASLATRSQRPERAVQEGRADPAPAIRGEDGQPFHPAAVVTGPRREDPDRHTGLAGDQPERRVIARVGRELLDPAVEGFGVVVRVVGKGCLEDGVDRRKIPLRVDGADVDPVGVGTALRWFGEVDLHVPVVAHRVQAVAACDRGRRLVHGVIECRRSMPWSVPAGPFVCRAPRSRTPSAWRRAAPCMPHRTPSSA